MKPINKEGRQTTGEQQRRWGKQNKQATKCLGSDLISIWMLEQGLDERTHTDFRESTEPGVLKH